MDNLIARILQLDDQRQVAFHIALTQQVEPVIAPSKDYHYAKRAIDLCWDWVEHHKVTAMAMYSLVLDEDDFGVLSAMHVAHSRDLTEWNAWGCFVDTLTYAASCAFGFEGVVAPEGFDNALPDEYVAQFMSYYHAVVGPSGIPVLLVEWLEGASDDQLTRAVVWGKVQEFIAALA